MTEIELIEARIGALDDAVMAIMMAVSDASKTGGDTLQSALREIGMKRQADGAHPRHVGALREMAQQFHRYRTEFDPKRPGGTG